MVNVTYGLQYAGPDGSSQVDTLGTDILVTTENQTACKSSRIRLTLQ